MFVFIHDVKPDGRPTLAARGSHRTIAYYSHLDAFDLTRISHAFVQRHHEIVPLIGPAGGGFLLDTNALHRAQLDGVRSRTAILLEWHAHRKIAALASHPAVTHLPCPSIKTGAHHWMLGVPGYPLYPPDTDAPPQLLAKYQRRGGGATTVRRRKAQHLGEEELGYRRRRRTHSPTSIGTAARASPMAVADAKLGRIRHSMTSGSLPQPSSALVGFEVEVPRTSEAHVRADIAAARRCFSRPAPSGCAAVYIAAPAPSSSGMRAAFVALAAGSARSLKRVLPFARTVLVLGYRGDDGQPNLVQSAGSGSLPTNHSTAEQSDIPQSELAAFDEVIAWHDPALYALASLFSAHRGWLLKPAMIAQAASRYERIVLFDADSSVEHNGVAALFAMLESERRGDAGSHAVGRTAASVSGPSSAAEAAPAVDFFAAADVATSRSRRALGGQPIYNSGVMGLRTNTSETRELLRRWQAWVYAIACALPEKDTRLPPGVPPSLGPGAAWALATNDQFGLAKAITPNWMHPALRGLQRRTLDSRYNWRGAAAATAVNASSGAEIEAPIIVRHDGRRKSQELIRRRQQAMRLPFQPRPLPRTLSASRSPRAAAWAEACAKASPP